MRHPQIYTVNELKEWTVYERIDGVVRVPARPLPPYGVIFFWRTLKIAWRVFTGKYDALHWEHRPEKTQEVSP
jgi:hypothetical protein